MSTAAAAIEALRERTESAVQTFGRRPADHERARRENLAVFSVAFAGYAVVGYWLVTRMHVVDFASLDRLNRALMLWHNDPARLSSVGFDYPPLSVLWLAPFTLVPSMATSLVALPLVSALFAAGTMVLLNTMMRRTPWGLPTRLSVLALIGANPLVVMYASIGASLFLWLAFVVAALGALFTWYITAEVRYVLLAGLAYGAAALTGYWSWGFFLISLVMIGSVLVRLGARGDEVEGTTAGFAAPAVYASTVWILFNLILLLNPFAWLAAQHDRHVASGWADAGVPDVARATVELVFYGAPIAIVVLPALFVVGLTRRNGCAVWLGLILSVAIFAPALSTLTHLSAAPMSMSNAVTITLVAVVGAVWLARSAGRYAPHVAGALALGLLASIPWTFMAMERFPQQGLERAFHDAVVTRQSQEGNLRADGSPVGYDNELAMAAYIDAHIEEPNSILTDNRATYAVMLFTGRPDLFFDRIDKTDAAWQRAASDPVIHARYLLLSVDPWRDALTQRYPDAAAGTDDDFPVVHKNDRYVLVALPDPAAFIDLNPEDGQP